LLPQPLITPTTKGASGVHDEPISESEVVSRGLVDESTWELVRTAALSLFTFGQQIANQADLILADTKYEFGYDQDGQLILIDEMHTPDSSRFWERSTYETRVAEGADPESLDKEPIRRALAGLGYTGDGPPPDLGVDVIEATSTRYIKAFERITGDEFLPGEYPVGDRIKSALKSKGVL
jgi:phosphoribosylaminoimidazole-succinocarboxamide synthase